MRIAWRSGNQLGKEAVVAMVGPGDFFGEGCLAGQKIRMGTATAIMPTAVLAIEKNDMARALHAEHALSDRFMAYVLSRTGANAFAAGALWQGTPPGTDTPESV